MASIRLTCPLTWPHVAKTLSDLKFCLMIFYEFIASAQSARKLRMRCPQWGWTKEQSGAKWGRGSCPHQKETLMAAIESRREKFAAHHGKVSSLLLLLLLQLPLLLSLFLLLLLLLWQPFKNLSGCSLWLGACCMHMAHVATPTKSSGIRPQCVPPASFVCTNNNNNNRAEGKKKRKKSI